jgi:hypothetical protein
MILCSFTYMTFFPCGAPQKIISKTKGTWIVCQVWEVSVWGVEVNFHGGMIIQQGLQMDFLGLDSHYSKFIKNYKIDTSFHKPLEKVFRVWMRLIMWRDIWNIEEKIDDNTNFEVAQLW